MGDKDLTEPPLETYDDVFADIVNALIFNGKWLIEESDLSPETARSIYEDDGKLHEHDLAMVKYRRNALSALLYQTK